MRRSQQFTQTVESLTTIWLVHAKIGRVRELENLLLLFETPETERLGARPIHVFWLCAGLCL
jgi:hypothetical protein